jgi:hypothetical protein
MKPNIINPRWGGDTNVVGDGGSCWGENYGDGAAYGDGEGANAYYNQGYDNNDG